MQATDLRARQAPFKDRYRSDPAAAKHTLVARGSLDPERIVCRVEPQRRTIVDAGLHPLAGGDEGLGCAAEWLLESLVACAGVTLGAVATALGIPVQGGEIVAEGDLDFSGTLGVNRETPVGFSALRVAVRLVAAAEPAQLERLAQLTERYCVVAQSLKTSPVIRVTLS